MVTLALLVVAHQVGQNQLSPVRRIQQYRRVSSPGAMVAYPVPPSLLGVDSDVDEVLLLGSPRWNTTESRDCYFGLVGQLFRAGTHPGSEGFLRCSEKGPSEQDSVHSIGFGHYQKP